MSNSNANTTACDISTQDEHNQHVLLEPRGLTSTSLLVSYSELERKIKALRAEVAIERVEKRQENKKFVDIQHRIQALLNFLPGGIIILNEKGRIVESNPSADAFLGGPLKGKIWRNIISECFSPKSDDGLEISTKLGRRLSVSTSSFGHEGQIILLTDQTETRRLQERVSRNERLSAIGKMVSALAHQLRTPLSAALLYANHLCDHSIPSETRKKFAQKNLSRLRHMEKQVRDMMLFVKSELPLNEIVSLKDLEAELRAAAEVAIHDSNISCQWNNEAPKQLLKCHLEALVSALMNLVNNAIQSYIDGTDRNNGIEIHIHSGLMGNKESIFIDIIDFGAGMNDEMLRRIEQAFTTTKAQGTGLGLAVVRSVANAHGAKFKISSKPSVGTVASLSIPAFLPNKHV